MKRIEEFRGIHKGKTIWVVGRSPNILKYPKGFFGPPRIAIGLNAAFIRHPECKYFLSNHIWGRRGDKTEEAAKEILPEILKKFITLLVTTPTEFTKHWYLPDMAYAQKYSKDVLAYGRWLGDPNAKKEEFQEAVEKIMVKKDCLLVQKGTVSHFAIQVAALMGAKKIILAGCEAKTGKKQWADDVKGTGFRMDKGEFPKTYQEGKILSFIWYRNGTIWLANALKKYGVEVVRFNPETMKEEAVPTEDEKFSLQLGGSEFPFLFHQQGYLMMDYPESRGTSFVSDFRKPFPFEDESITRIIAFHSLCRLSEEEIVPTLWECHRVLVPDGGLLVTVPEFAWICRSYLEKGVLTSDLIERLYGSSYEWRLQHRYCFSLQNLYKVLRSAGFGRYKMMNSKIFKKEFFGDDKVTNASIYQEGDLIVEAIKEKSRGEEMEEKGVV